MRDQNTRAMLIEAVIAGGLIAIRQVEHDWKQHRYYQYLERKKPEEAKLTMSALHLLREDGANLFQQPDCEQF